MVPQTGIFVGYREWPEYDGDLLEIIDEIGEVGEPHHSLDRSDHQDSEVTA